MGVGHLVGEKGAFSNAAPEEHLRAERKCTQRSQLLNLVTIRKLQLYFLGFGAHVSGLNAALPLTDSVVFRHRKPLIF